VRAAFVEATGDPSTLRIGERPTPDAGAGEVRLLVRAAGVGPWDVKAMQGRFGELPMPFTVGFEFAGVVDQVGEGVTDIAVGHEVYGTDRRAGSFAEYRVAAVEDLALKPTRFSFEEAAALVVGGCTALEGVIERLNVQPGETLLVTGASGGVGTLAVQLAKNAGARVVAVASRQNHDYLNALGASHAVDYHEPDWAAAARAAEGPADALFDIAGGETLTTAFEAVKDGGRAVGVVFGGPDTAPRGISFERFSAASGRDRLRRLAEMADAGDLRVELAAELPLDSAKDALERAISGHTRGKVVLKLY
jgi:NADPH:quinone reductase-like Zn-dependent oxidoreductase